MLKQESLDIVDPKAEDFSFDFQKNWFLPVTFPKNITLILLSEIQGATQVFVTSLGWTIKVADRKDHEIVIVRNSENWHIVLCSMIQHISSCSAFLPCGMLGIVKAITALTGLIYRQHRSIIHGPGAQAIEFEPKISSNPRQILEYPRSEIPNIVSQGWKRLVYLSFTDFNNPSNPWAPIHHKATNSTYWLEALKA